MHLRPQIWRYMECRFPYCLWHFLLSGWSSLPQGAQDTALPLRRFAPLCQVVNTLGSCWGLGGDAEQSSGALTHRAAAEMWAPPAPGPLQPRGPCRSQSVQDQSSWGSGGRHLWAALPCRCSMCSLFRQGVRCRAHRPLFSPISFFCIIRGKLFFMHASGQDASYIPCPLMWPERLEREPRKGPCGRYSESLSVLVVITPPTCQWRWKKKVKMETQTAWAYSCISALTNLQIWIPMYFRLCLYLEINTPKC